MNLRQQARIPCLPGTEWAEKLNEKFNKLPGIGWRYFGGGDTSIEQVSNLTTEGRNLINNLSIELLGQFGQRGIGGGPLQGITPFQGTRPGEVPFSPLQQQGFGLAGGLGEGIGAGIDIFGQGLGGFDPAQGQEFLGQAGELLQGATQPFDPQSIISALEPGREFAQRQFERETVPFLSERFGATAGASGALNQALAQAGTDLSLGLGAQAAPFLAQGQQAQLDRQLQGVGLAGNLAQLPGALAGQATQLGGQATDLLGQLLNIGQIQRTFPQALAGAEQSRFGEAQPFANPFITNFAPLALGTPAFQNIGVQNPPGIGTTLLQGLGTFAGSQGLGGLAGGVGGLAGGVGGLAGATAGGAGAGLTSALSFLMRLI